MKIKILLLAFFSLVLTSNSFSQFDKPLFQFGIGIAEPMDDLKGDDYVFYAPNGFIYIDTNFIAKNYAAKTGLHFFGAAKINFDKYSITRGVGFISFNTFNTFQSTRTGVTGILIAGDTLPTSVQYDYSFTNFAIGFGFEIAPSAFTNIISPFAGVNLSLNFMGGELTRTEGFNDTNRVGFNGFRLGVNFNGGIEVKVNKNFGIVAGIKYDLGNLLLQSNDRSVSGRIEWGRTGVSLNDEEGQYISNLSSPIGGQFEYYNNEEKKVNWGTIYLGLNFYPNIGKKSK